MYVRKYSYTDSCKKMHLHHVWYGFWSRWLRTQDIIWNFGWSKEGSHHVTLIRRTTLFVYAFFSDRIETGDGRCTLYFPMYFVLSDVLCTVGCTLYFQFWKYKVHPKVHDHEGINIFCTGNIKRVQSTFESTFLYIRMYSVLSIVLCTFTCTLKSTRCTLKSTRCTLKKCTKTWFNFLKNQKIGN